MGQMVENWNEQKAQKIKRQALATELIQVYAGDINYDLILKIIKPHHLLLRSSFRSLDYFPYSKKASWRGGNMG